MSKPDITLWRSLVDAGFSRTSAFDIALIYATPGPVSTALRAKWYLMDRGVF